MDAVEYVKQRKRMCDYCGDCDKCPAKKVVGCASLTKISQMVPIVEQWAKEHPVKTRQNEFFKQWPDAEIGYDGLPTVAPCQLNVELLQCESQKDCEDRGVCGKCRCDFWLKEIE
jgi:hypothetical protein